MKVAFQGERGAYSELALINFFQSKASALGFALSEQVIEALLAKEVDYAILPVENSIVGNVTVNLDLIYKEKVEVWGEHFQPIKHCLMTLPGTALEDITEAASHPIALSQCRDFLSRHNIRAHAEYDTAGAAKLLRQNSAISKGKAIVASELCAKYYDLEILSDKIQNNDTNLTRFLIMSRAGENPNTLEKNKTSIAFATSHQPGSLLECLQCFSAHKLNMTKIESRPDPMNPFQYVFFVDFIGDQKNSEVSACLNELEKLTKTLKVLGSYNAASLV
tara:strand:- start:16009 stop:16839 length:831 start_codon:yes stop_codon:yes gene_type:complete